MSAQAETGNALSLTLFHAPPSDISNATAMTHDDIFFVLRERELIVDFDKLRSAAASSSAGNKARNGGASPHQRTGHSRTTTGWTIRKRSQNNSFSAARVEGSSSRKPHADDPHGIPTAPIPRNYKISFDPIEVAAHVEKWARKDYITLKPDKLHWTPFLVTRGFGLDVNVGSTALEGAGEAEVGALGGVAGHDHEQREGAEPSQTHAEGDDTAVTRSPTLRANGVILPAPRGSQSPIRQTPLSPGQVEFDTLPEHSPFARRDSEASGTNDSREPTTAQDDSPPSAHDEDFVMADDDEGVADGNSESAVMSDDELLLREGSEHEDDDDDVGEDDDDDEEIIKASRSRKRRRESDADAEEARDRPPTRLTRRSSEQPKIDPPKSPQRVLRKPSQAPPTPAANRQPSPAAPTTATRRARSASRPAVTIVEPSPDLVGPPAPAPAPPPHRDDIIEESPEVVTKVNGASAGLEVASAVRALRSSPARTAVKELRQPPSPRISATPSSEEEEEEAAVARRLL